MALQIIDIVTLRPEIQLCYVGISTKCFEILESRGASDNTGLAAGGVSDVAGVGLAAHPSEDGSVVEVADVGSDGEETTDEEEDEEASETDEEGTPTSHTDPDETQSEASEGGDSDSDSFVETDQASRARLRLREILFYDDKVAIFKARHGKL